MPEAGTSATGLSSRIGRLLLLEPQPSDSEEKATSLRITQLAVVREHSAYLSEEERHLAESLLHRLHMVRLTSKQNPFALSATETFIARIVQRLGCLE